MNRVLLHCIRRVDLEVLGATLMALQIILPYLVSFFKTHSITAYSTVVQIPSLMIPYLRFSDSCTSLYEIACPLQSTAMVVHAPLNKAGVLLIYICFSMLVSQTPIIGTQFGRSIGLFILYSPLCMHFNYLSFIICEILCNCCY